MAADRAVVATRRKGAHRVDDRRVISGIVHMLKSGSRRRDCWKSTAPTRRSRKHPHRYDKTAYKGRNVIERMFCRLKDFRRIATRYDKRADIFLSAILLAAAITR